MILDELEYAYGPYVAEMVRQALTLEEFNRLEIEELVPYFSLRSAMTYREYIDHQGDFKADQSSARSSDEYNDVLRKRWQRAEELAQLVLQAERDRQDTARQAV